MDRLSEDERAALEAAGEESEAPARLPGIILQVVSLVRGKVAACKENRGRMASSGMIPDECLFAATTIAREALIASQPTPEGVTDPRKEEIRQAYLYLEKVASCDVAIADNSGNYPGEPITSPSVLFGGCERHCF